MNAVLKPQHIETIFDHDLTDDERETLTFGLTENEYINSSSAERINMGLASLFGMRGDTEKSDFFIDKLDPIFVKTCIKWDAYIH